jgi:DUF917 family protein
MPVIVVALSSNGLVWRPTVAHPYYQMVTVAMSEIMMSPKPVTTENHNNDERFDDITKEPL